jgi:hypothetical protein
MQAAQQAQREVPREIGCDVVDLRVLGKSTTKLGVQR